MNKNESSTTDPETDITETVQPETDDDTASIQVRTSSFSEGALVQAYKKYVESIQGSKPRMYSTLVAQQPALLDNAVIQLKMSNQNQIDEFYKSAKPDLMRFLKDELRNDSITVDVILEENSSTNLIYSPEDKFKHLMSKNPLLGKMRQMYGLDFD